MRTRRGGQVKNKNLGTIRNLAQRPTTNFFTTSFPLIIIFPK